MRRKREKGFKKVSIVDFYSETKESCFENCNIHLITYLIILGICFILIGITIIYYIYYKINKEKEEEITYDDSSSLDLKKKNLKNNNISSYISQSSDSYDKKEIKNVKHEFPGKNFGKGDPLISIIIISEPENGNIEELLNSIYEQTFKNIEIVILDDNKTNTNNEFYKKVKEKNIKGITIIEYPNKVGKLRKRLDGINNSRSPFLLYMDSDDSFNTPNTLDIIYSQIIEDKVDILEFNSRNEENSIIYQPKLFDKMYFDQDTFYLKNNLCLAGKLIRKELLIKVLNSIDDFYMEQNMSFFEESLMLYPLFKNAQSYKLIKTGGTKKNSPYYSCIGDFSWNELNNDFIVKDFLLYISYIFKFSDNNVPEKRRIAFIFINNLEEKRRSFLKIVFKNFLNDTINLFLDCNKISDADKYRIKEFQDYAFKNK